MTIKQYREIRKRFYADPTHSDSKYLLYAYLVGLIEGDAWFSVTKKGYVYCMSLVLNSI